jgi:hydroxypyruvate reductase
MEAKQMGRLLADLATADRNYGKSSVHSRAIIMGGETTVEIIGTGKGGRNQESVLWASEGIVGLPGTVVAALGTDGIDGNSNAAGALADGRTSQRARTKGLDPSRFLARNDSYRFFRALKDSLVTGPTGTNVGDLYVMVSVT